MLEHIVSGLIRAGWVILPLLLLSVAGWALAFQRMLTLGRMSWRGKNRFHKNLAEGSWDGYLENLNIRRIANRPEGILRDVYAARRGGREAMEAKLDEAMKFLTPELEKSLSTLAILASAAPLLGLLGTVEGMVRTFEVIGAFGTGNQALMSDSISESLMATQSGLLVAFPLMLVHIYLSSRSEALEKETLATAHAIINRCAARDNAPGLPREAWAEGQPA